MALLAEEVPEDHRELAALEIVEADFLRAFEYPVLVAAHRGKT